MENIEKIHVIDFMESLKDVGEETRKLRISNLVDKNTYIPLVAKKIALENIFAKSIATVDGTMYVDEFLSQFNMTTLMIELYTNLTFINPKDGHTTFDYYDELKESGIINDLFGLIPEREIKEMTKIYGQIRATHANKCEGANAVVDKVFNHIGALIEIFSGSGIDALAKLGASGDIGTTQG